MTDLTNYDIVVLSLGALFLGIIMLIKGGNWAIDSSVYMARRYGVSPMLVGFTIIAFGTSLPELVVSMFANLQGSPGIAIGNVLGSNIANILAVLGLTAILIPMTVTVSKDIKRDMVFMLAVSVLFVVLLQYGSITRIAGLLMVAILGSYVFYQYKTTSADAFESDEIDSVTFKNDYFAYATLFIGLACIAVGAEFLVKGAQVSAELIGVPESVIALSLIALGTSLPELSTSIIAARKKQAEMVIGNIVGSNVFNILMIIGFSTAVKPIMQGSFSEQLANFDGWITLLVAVLFAVVLFVFGRIGRVTGGLFFALYVAYNIYIYTANFGG